MTKNFVLCHQINRHTCIKSCFYMLKFWVLWNPLLQVLKTERTDNLTGHLKHSMASTSSKHKTQTSKRQCCMTSIIRISFIRRCQSIRHLSKFKGAKAVMPTTVIHQSIYWLMKTVCLLIINGWNPPNMTATGLNCVDGQTGDGNRATSPVSDSLQTRFKPHLPTDKYSLTYLYIMQTTTLDVTRREKWKHQPLNRQYPASTTSFSSTAAKR